MAYNRDRNDRRDRRRFARIRCICLLCGPGIEEEEGDGEGYEDEGVEGWACSSECEHLGDGRTGARAVASWRSYKIEFATV